MPQPRWPPETLRAWPEVLQLSDEVAAASTSSRATRKRVLRRLLAADADVRDIEVRRAGLAEAFAEITTRHRTQETLQ